MTTPPPDSSPRQRAEDRPVQAGSPDGQGGQNGGDKGARDGGATELGAKLLVLVVERDPHIRELEAHFLEQAGYSIQFASDGHAALEHARTLLPDVVITEILVPKLDGLALCRAIKADPATRDISVLIFSILAAAGRANEAGADAFLTKPLAEHRLVSTVRSLLEKRPKTPERAGGHASDQANKKEPR